MKRKDFVPTYTLDKILNLNLEKIKKYSNVFVDLDNTLASPYDKLPSIEMIEFINKLASIVNIYVCSNNHEDRVKLFCKDLNVKYIYELKKPNKKRLEKFIKDNNIDKSNSIWIGDQTMTDVLLANRIHIDSILLDKYANCDLPITFFPRILDNIFRKLNKKYNIEDF